MCFDYITTVIFKGCGHSRPEPYDYYYCPNTEATGIPCPTRLEMDDEICHEVEGILLSLRPKPKPKAAQKQ
ncbi:hypothetical protein Sste5346_000868 [Sporothrix stenoceras]|uniref:Uncharacterized protein n=1 Tax=Sporothrix stenoceras TaxID=5173 RepID=A0ABR3ZQM2_9PEZI